MRAASHLRCVEDEEALQRPPPGKLRAVPTTFVQLAAYVVLLRSE